MYFSPSVAYRIIFAYHQHLPFSSLLFFILRVYKTVHFAFHCGQGQSSAKNGIIHTNVPPSKLPIWLLLKNIFTPVYDRQSLFIPNISLFYIFFFYMLLCFEIVCTQDNRSLFCWVILIRVSIASSMGYWPCYGGNYRERVTYEKLCRVLDLTYQCSEESDRILIEFTQGYYDRTICMVCTDDKIVDIQFEILSYSR